MTTEKLKYKCTGCGLERPCYVEINQEPNKLFEVIDDLVCILDTTNQTSYNWEYVEVD